MPPTTLIQDSFDRADSTTGLGTADTGGTWAEPNGDFGIDTNEAYTPNSVTFGHAHIDAADADVDMRVTVATLGGDGNAGLIFRWSDSDNYWVLFINGVTDQMQLGKVISGSFNNVSTTDIAKGAGDELRVITNGSRIRTFWNGGFADNITDAFNENETNHGLWINNNTAWRLDDYLCRTLPVVPTGDGTDIDDSFDRSDSDDLGTADSGQTWQSQFAEIGIASNEAASKDLHISLGHAVIDADSADVTIECTLSTLGNQGNAGIVFRWSSFEDLWAWFIDGDTATVQLVRYADAAETVIGSETITKSNGDTLKVVTSGDSIECYHNGTLEVSTTDATYQTAEIHGLWFSTVEGAADPNNSQTSTAWRIDDFSVVGPAVGGIFVDTIVVGATGIGVG